MERLFAKDLYKMLTYAASKLSAEAEKVNALNVFPVPDGDTGSNMSMTVSGVNGMTENSLASISACSKEAADLMLRSARGNSGVILSVFFRGFALSLADLESAGVNELAAALSAGTESAYGAVMNPTEGTILSVMRAASEAVCGSSVNNIEEFFEVANKAASIALDHTPEQLPVLKEAGVVDAGGCGFMIILTAMTAMVSSDASVANFTVPKPMQIINTNAAANCNTEIKYPYCTECIVEKNEEYSSLGAAEELHGFVLSAGDSVVYVEDESIVKLHVHTSVPGEVLSFAQKFGMLLTVKIENMRKQHTELQSASNPVANDKTTEGVGFVSVTNGEGLKEIFIDLGVNVVVSGGQTMNPSTDDIFDAIKKTAKSTVYVLPNNSNIILAAQQAAEIAAQQGIDVKIIPSKSVPQGIAAMYSYDPDAGVDQNTLAMTEALASVRSLSVTHAVRNAVIGDLKIREGQYIGLVENKVKKASDELYDCVEQLIGELYGASCITAYFGSDFDESEQDKLQKLLSDKLGDSVDVTVISGGQPVYSLIISGE